MIAKEKRHMDVYALLTGEDDSLTLPSTVETVIVHTAGQAASSDRGDSGTSRSSENIRK